MSARSVLWIDLRSSPCEPDLCSSLPKTYSPQRVIHIADIVPAIHNWMPWAVCFEYDRPDVPGLHALVNLKHLYSSLPIVMLTEHHTRRLAAWALRCCVWDYLVKPLSIRNLCSCLASIAHGTSGPQSRSIPNASLAGSVRRAALPESTE